jgi:hypothetical protein
MSSRRPCAGSPGFSCSASPAAPRPQRPITYGKARAAAAFPANPARPAPGDVTVTMPAATPAARRPDLLAVPS